MDTFGRDLQLAALGNLDRLDRTIAGLRLGVLNLLDNIVALKHFAEHDVTAVEPPGGTLVSDGRSLMARDGRLTR